MTNHEKHEIHERQFGSMATLDPLPIDAILAEVVAAVRAEPALVLEAEPGAGKTTRVPRALLEAGLLERGECWVLEPRRLAARLAAVRVAEELGEPLGQRAGYAVRFEQKVSPATRIRFVTEGLLLRRLQEDPRLSGIAVVILDEFHERHVHTDLALALLRRLQGRDRPDLRLVVMSATLDAAPVAAFLGARRLRCAGRNHPVDLRHSRGPDARPLAAQVAEAVEALHGEGGPGHTLVFLPGAADIRQSMSKCEPMARRLGLRLLPLHGSLSFEAQKAVVAPSDGPKVIFSTNVAESSVTIPGVRAVVDSGLGREARHSPWSGLPSLRTVRVSQARCLQRAGRAGRQGPGVCLRLFTESEFRARPPFDEPDLLRADLAEPLLRLLASGVADPAGMAWLEPPPAAALEAGLALLGRLGALDGDGHLTDLGRRMGALPLHPRLARLAVAGADLRIPRLAALAAVLLETGDLSLRSDLGRPGTGDAHALDSDLWPRLDAFHQVERGAFSGAAIREAGLDGGAVHQARQALRGLANRSPEEPLDAEERLLRALLLAYPDRVARAGGKGTFRVVGGTGARLDPASRCQREPLVVALEAETTGREVIIKVASRIEPDWLLDAFPDAVREAASLAFNPQTGAVERREALLYGDLAFDESRRRADPADPATGACLAAALLERGFPEGYPEVRRILDRVAFVGRHRADFPVAGPGELARLILDSACQGCASLKDVDALDWKGAFRSAVGEGISRQLEAWAPETVGLPGRRLKVHYEGETPHVASRLQDFLGMREGPRLLGGTVPLVLHLLAPNQRAVQVTTDLDGFWRRAYLELRPKLSRRYPRHHWPEKPV
jgi:ATP-dependent helicase HrpB